MNIRKINPLIVATYMFFLLTYIEDTIPYGQIFTFSALALMILSCYGSGKKGFYLQLKSGFLGYMVIFFVFCILSTLWAEDASRTLVIVRGMLMVLIEMTIVYSCHYERTSVDSFLKLIMYGGYIVVFYAVLRYGWSNIISAFSEDIRISNELLNANTLGMCAAYSMVINFYYILYERPRLLDLLMVPSLVIIAASGSRKSIVIVVSGMLALVFLKNLQNKNFATNMLKGFIGLILVVGIFFLLSRLPIFEILRSRMNGLWSIVTGTAVKGTSGYIRMVYNETGIELFKQHPILGIGLHNASRYIGQYYGHVHFHNNFIELLACGGIVGFLVHYSIYFCLFVFFWKTRKNRTKEYDICLILLAIRFVMGYGHIQYYQILTYFYLMVFYLFAVRKKKQLRETKEVPEQ